MPIIDPAQAPQPTGPVKKQRTYVLIPPATAPPKSAKANPLGVPVYLPKLLELLAQKLTVCLAIDAVYKINTLSSFL